ncbi:hypothetical protein Tco_1423657, partial [Tanacetum coccineum]
SKRSDESEIGWSFKSITAVGSLWFESITVGLYEMVMLFRNQWNAVNDIEKTWKIDRNEEYRESKERTEKDLGANWFVRGYGGKAFGGLWGN